MEEFVGAAAGTAAGTELAGRRRAAFLVNNLGSPGNQTMVIFAAGQGRGFSGAFRLAENADGRLGNGFAIGIDPEQRVVVLRGADVLAEPGLVGELDDHRGWLDAREMGGLVEQGRIF